MTRLYNLVYIKNLYMYKTGLNQMTRSIKIKKTMTSIKYQNLVDKLT